jgi:hypothetical protein
MSARSVTLACGAWAATAAIVMLAGCAPIQPTAIVLRVECDAPVSRVLVAARRGTDAPFFSESFMVTDAQPLPGELTIVAKDPADARPFVIDVTAELVRGARPSLRQSFVVRPQRERTLALRARLSSWCDTPLDRCPAVAQNCVEGGCESVVRGSLADITVDRACGVSEGPALTSCGRSLCVDLQRDPDHCGACGRVCEGAEGERRCVAGVCAPPAQGTGIRCDAAQPLVGSITDQSTEPHSGSAGACGPGGDGERFYRVLLAPRSSMLVTARAVGEANVIVRHYRDCSTAATRCEQSAVARPVATLRLVNEDDRAQRTEILSVASGSLEQPTRFALEIARLSLADNTSCRTAALLRYGETVSGDGAEGVAGPQISDLESRYVCVHPTPSLYYALDVAPMRMASIRAVSMRAGMLASASLECGAMSCFDFASSNSLPGMDTMRYANVTSVSRRVYITMSGEVRLPLGPFTLTATDGPLVAGVDCALPIVLAPNTEHRGVAIVGAARRCAVSGTLAYVAMDVPPRSTARIALTNTSSFSDSSVLTAVAMASACARDCSSSRSFTVLQGNTGTMMIVNSSAAPMREVFHLSGDARSTYTARWTFAGL